jgi:hypothetical protein
MLSKALEMGVCFHWGLILWGTWMDTPFLGPLRKKKNSLVGEFYEEFARHIKESSVNRQLSPLGAPVGESGGGSLTGSVE